MKQIFGIWLPDDDAHFEGMMRIAPHYMLDDRMVGTYQIDKLQEALSYVRKERRRVALDIGAHVGYWSMWLAKYFDTVHAFEPAWEHSECFEQNVPDGNVVLHRCAAGRDFGSLGIVRDETNTGKAHMEGPGTIAVRPIDAEKFEEVDFIKIDVEGMEPDVIEGARETILRCKPIVIVEQKGHHDRYGFRRDEAFDRLKDLGMRQVKVMGADRVFSWKKHRPSTPKRARKA